MLVKHYANNVVAKISLSGPGEIVSCTLRWPGGESGPHYFPNEGWAVREVEAAMARLALPPSRLGILIATLLMLTVAAGFAYALVSWLASLPAAILMALLLLGR